MNFIEPLIDSYRNLFSNFSVPFTILYETSFIWLPFILGVAAFKAWMGYIRAWTMRKESSVLLEIHLPKEIYRSPAAMEIFFAALYQKGGPKNYIEGYYNGVHTPWFSAELVSIDGYIRFFIWARKKFKGMIETQLYAQYPDIKVSEVHEDYVKDIFVDPKVYTMWGTYFKIGKADAFPIKTYIDYGLDKDTEDEYKIDPMSSVLEYLGSLRKGEQAWIQILFQANREEGLKDGKMFKKKDWKDGVKAEQKKILEGTKDKDGRSRPMTPSESDTYTALSRSVSKFAFDTMIRGFYIAKNDSFDPTRIPGLINAFKQYSFDGYNQIGLGKYTDFDNPWQDFRRIRRTKLEKKMLDAYKLRSFFQDPYQNYRAKPFVFTTEELATVFHFPSGITVQTPTLQRIPSKRSGPPSNLPI